MESIYALIEAAQTGDAAAKEELLLLNNGLIWSVVKRFQGRAETDDLYQIGAIGLLKSIEKFDFNYPVRFSTYAVPMIIGEIRRFLRDDGTIKVSRSLKDLAWKAIRFQEQIQKTENRELSVSELAIYLNVTQEELILAMEANKSIESMDFIKKGEKEHSLSEHISDKTENEKIYG